VNAAELIRWLWARQSERDLQKTIGASEFGSPCTYCVAQALLARHKKGQSQWWLAARIGTAVHLDLDETAAKYLPQTMREYRVWLGELPEYGEISSSLDFYDPEKAWLVDWKTTERAKMRLYKIARVTEPHPLETTEMGQARFTLDKYRGQIMSYGRGLVMAGYPVDNVSMGFINRDGKEDDDIWSIDLEYDPDYAEHVWDRLSRIWDYLRRDGDPEALTRHIFCRTCNF
jgi:hypothetical protein